MFMMPSRLEYIQYALNGFAKTKIPLVAYNGDHFVPLSSVADDMGIYLIIPKIAYYLSLTPQQAVYAFVYGLVFIAWLLGCTGFFKLYKTKLARIVAVLGLSGLALITARMVDVYVAYAVVAMVVIPWFFYFLSNQETKFTRFTLFMLMVGMACAGSHYIRAWSSMGLLLFLMTGLFFVYRGSLLKKCALLCALLIGIATVWFYFDSSHKNYISYARSVAPALADAPKNHVFWHTVYLGFGFLSNDLGIAWDDSVGQKKALSVDPQAIYPSNHYEKIMRQQVVHLIRHHPKFVAYTLFAKLGVILMYALIFINVGLLAAFLYPLACAVQCSFLLALVFNALFGLIAMPYTNYLLGFITFCVLYGIMSIGAFLERKALT